MSRLGITFDDVAQAAGELVKDGEVPTIDKIRTALGGTGSFTTISKYLNAWRHGIPSGQAINRTNAPDIVQSAVERVWQEIHEQADAEIEKVKSEAAEKIDSATQQIKQLGENYNQLKQSYDELEQLFQRKSAEKELISLDFKRLNDEQLILQERYKSLEERYTDMQGITSKHLKDLSGTHKGEIIRLDEKNKLLENQYEKLISELKCQNEKERHQYMSDLDSLKTDNQKLNKFIASLEEKIKINEINLTRLNTENKSLKLESDEAKKRLNEQSSIWRDFSGKSLISEDILIKINEFPKIDSFINNFKQDFTTTIENQFMDMKNYLDIFNQPKLTEEKNE